MNWKDLFAAIALYLVLEGLLPFASPAAWRRSLATLGRLSDAQLRTFGLSIMIVGLVLLVLVRKGL
jgi:uncharacterized protein YjeT (DUF2065 family)